MGYSRTKAVEMHVMEVAFLLVTKEFMQDNSEDLYRFFREEHINDRRIDAEKKQKFFDEKKSLMRVNGFIKDYSKTREKMIKMMDALGASNFEDRLENKEVLDHYMNILNDFILKVRDELDGKLGESDTIVVDGKFSDD